MTSLLRLILFVAVLSLLTPSSAANSNEILIPVTGDEQARLLKKGHHFLEQLRYVSKRIRIVKVNTDPLLGDVSSVVISPFDDVSISLDRSNLQVRPNGLGFVWEGFYGGLPETKTQTLTGLAAEGLDADTASRFYDDVFSVKITGSKYVFDNTTGKSESLSAITVDSSGVLIPARDSNRLKSKRDRREFYEVLVDLRPPPILSAQRNDVRDARPRSYQVRSLPADRRYHVVYEVDPEKLLPVGKFDAASNPEAAEKVRKFREFRKSLGPNPRAASEEETQ